MKILDLNLSFRQLLQGIFYNNMRNAHLSAQIVYNFGF